MYFGKTPYKKPPKKTGAVLFPRNADTPQIAKNIIDDRPKVSALPSSGRKSLPDYPGANNFSIQGSSEYATIEPEYLVELIPLIRTLVQLNPDVSQAVHNIVSLGNTGHKVFFDRKVSSTQVDKMRNHLVNKRKQWAPGQAGIDGLVNKLFSQILISGALSGEWVPNTDMTGIQTCVLVNPENIVFKLQRDKITYKPFQRIKNSFLSHIRERREADLIELNTNTYQYYALNGDGESPYAFPPYLPVVKRIEAQGKMNNNIDFIVDIVGLVGFLEVLIEKPDQGPSEKQKDYESRLESLLVEAKNRVIGGIKDGVVVGYNSGPDGTTFKFNSASKTFEQVVELYKNNELQIASALKQDASLWGRDYGTSEAKANVTFIKMLSELRNIQNLVKTFLEYGYALELRLAGYEFDFLNVVFNRSTLQDDLKYQQAQEIMVKNVNDKMVMGMINQDQAADELGYEAPAFPKPLVPWELLAGGSVPKPDTPGAPSAKVKRQGQKNKSAKKTRDKNKTVTK